MRTCLNFKNIKKNNLFILNINDEELIHSIVCIPCIKRKKYKKICFGSRMTRLNL